LTAPTPSAPAPASLGGARRRRAVQAAGPARGEQTRARYPDAGGFVERDGVRIFDPVPGPVTVPGVYSLPSSAGGAAAAIIRRWERRVKSTVSATIPIVNHQL
jgi:hypothetical protein